MYEVFNTSAVTLNHHIDIADDCAGNARLFEATGVGTLLITDWKRNLPDLFEPGQEIVAYRSPQECVEMIRYYLDHTREREAIAQAGKQRTLREHTYHTRMQEFVEIVQPYLSRTGGSRRSRTAYRVEEPEGEVELSGHVEVLGSAQREVRRLVVATTRRESGATRVMTARGVGVGAHHVIWRIVPLLWVSGMPAQNGSHQHVLHCASARTAT